ncbi:hypothetical protein EHS25_009745 [Saitozyma podzolica]|uniref:Transcription initiation factor TFIID subunit 12 domain-containing protein n=1 Tax=Saitozyma podzolica TaxID=1890683 RepID=A0A427YK53_9TREE|nr:hypothetical protein EHS25_009745 [Saitozyma podzolica]
MSRPPPPGGPSTAPAPVRPESAKNEMSKILSNLPSLMNLARAGKLSPSQVVQLRQILVMQHRQIVAQSISAGRPNPLRDLPPSLDPTTSFQGANALVTKAEFEKQIAAAEKDVRDKLALRVQNAAARASTPTGTASGTGAGGNTVTYCHGTGSGIVAIAVTSASAGAGAGAGTIDGCGADVAVMTPGGVRPPGTPQTGQPVRPVVRPLPPGLFNAKEMKTFVDMSRETRERYLNSNPDVKARFQKSLSYWTQNGQNSTAAQARPPQIRPPTVRPVGSQPPSGTSTGASSPAPSPSRGGATSGPPARPPAATPASSLPPQPSAAGPSTATPSVSGGPSGSSGPAASGAASQAPQTRVTAPGPSTTQPGQATMDSAKPPATPVVSTPIAVVPPPKPEPPPMIPRETEDARRKRKVREWLAELGPGLDVQVGVDSILGDVLDSFVLEAAGGAVRMAKHRKSDKIEVKDAAFFLEKTYGMTVPGFDALVTDRVHQPPEEKKKAQAVAPRAARRALLAAAASTGVTANGSGSGSGPPAGEAGTKGV